MTKTLRGDRNQCAGCGEYFNSTFAFEKHRAGDHGKDRRCLTVDEMRAKGMDHNAAGFWVSALSPDFYRATPMHEDEAQYMQDNLVRTS